MVRCPVWPPALERLSEQSVPTFNARANPESRSHVGARRDPSSVRKRRLVTSGARRLARHCCAAPVHLQLRELSARSQRRRHVNAPEVALVAHGKRSTPVGRWGHVEAGSQIEAVDDAAIQWSHQEQPVLGGAEQ